MTDKDVIPFPIPEVSDLDRPYWEGVKKGILLLQKCLDCNQLQLFPRPVCVRCFSINLDWQQSSGMGKVYTFAPVYAPPHPGVRKHVESTGMPAIFSIIELDEGVRIVSEIVGSKPEEIELGTRVKLSCEVAQGTDFKLPKFRVAK